jgi:hypothetical protein
MKAVDDDHLCSSAATRGHTAQVAVHVDQSHLEAIVAEARAIVDSALGSSA